VVFFFSSERERSGCALDFPPCSQCSLWSNKKPPPCTQKPTAFSISFSAQERLHRMSFCGPYA
jgi:hypothetical protein